MRRHKRILFNGDGYKADWLKEAAKRGLPNAPTTPEALKALARKENADVFRKYGVYTARELESRYEIALEDYVQKVVIEGNCALDMVSTLIVPAVKEEYAATLASFAEAEKAGIASGTAALRHDVVDLGNGLDSLMGAKNVLAKALDARDTSAIIAAMTAMRTTVDQLERRVSDARWPLPKYREMLFVY